MAAWTLPYKWRTDAAGLNRQSDHTPNQDISNVSQVATMHPPSRCTLDTIDYEKKLMLISACDDACPAGQ
jgi:hypothetical protein